jgi:hypothetical protein
VLALALSLAIALGYIVLLGGKPRSVRLLLPALAAGLLTSTIAIGLYQAVTDGAAGYYAVKALYSTFVLAGCTVALAVGLIAADTRLANNRVQRLAAGATASLLMFALPGAALSERLIRIFVAGLPVAADQSRLLEASVRDHPYGTSERDDVWIVDGCSPLRDFVLSKWIYDLSLGWTNRREDLLRQVRKIRNGHPFAAIAESAADPSVDSLTVYVQRPCQLDDLRRLEDTPKVTVVWVR